MGRFDLTQAVADSKHQVFRVVVGAFTLRLVVGEKGEEILTTYAVIEIEILNEQAMQPYMGAVSDIIFSHGGKYLVRLGQTDVVEGCIGEYPDKVVLEFPSKEAAKGWYNSPEYQAILPYRTENSRCNFLWVEGV